MPLTFKQVGGVVTNKTALYILNVDTVIQVFQKVLKRLDEQVPYGLIAEGAKLGHTGAHY